MVKEDETMCWRGIRINPLHPNSNLLRYRRLSDETRVIARLALLEILYIDVTYISSFTVMRVTLHYTDMKFFNLATRAKI